MTTPVFQDSRLLHRLSRTLNLDPTKGLGKQTVRGSGGYLGESFESSDDEGTCPRSGPVYETRARYDSLAQTLRARQSKRKIDIEHVWSGKHVGGAGGTTTGGGSTTTSGGGGSGSRWDALPQIKFSREDSCEESSSFSGLMLSKRSEALVHAIETQSPICSTTAEAMGLLFPPKTCPTPPDEQVCPAEGGNHHDAAKTTRTPTTLRTPAGARSSVDFAISFTGCNDFGGVERGTTFAPEAIEGSIVVPLDEYMSADDTVQADARCSDGYDYGTRGETFLVTDEERFDRVDVNKEGGRAARKEPWESVGEVDDHVHDQAESRPSSGIGGEDDPFFEEQTGRRFEGRRLEIVVGKKRFVVPAGPLCRCSYFFPCHFNFLEASGADAAGRAWSVNLSALLPEETHEHFELLLKFVLETDTMEPGSGRIAGWFRRNILSDIPREKVCEELQKWRKRRQEAASTVGGCGGSGGKGINAFDPPGRASMNTTAAEDMNLIRSNQSKRSKQCEKKKQYSAPPVDETEFSLFRRDNLRSIIPLLKIAEALQMDLFSRLAVAVVLSAHYPTIFIKELLMDFTAETRDVAEDACLYFLARNFQQALDCPQFLPVLQDPWRFHPLWMARLLLSDLLVVADEDVIVELLVAYGKRVGNPRLGGDEEVEVDGKKVVWYEDPTSKSAWDFLSADVASNVWPLGPLFLLARRPFSDRLRKSRHGQSLMWTRQPSWRLFEEIDTFLRTGLQKQMQPSSDDEKKNLCADAREAKLLDDSFGTGDPDHWRCLNPIDVDPFIAGILAPALHGDVEVSFPAFLRDCCVQQSALPFRTDNSTLDDNIENIFPDPAVLQEETSSCCSFTVRFKTADLFAQQYRQRNYLSGLQPWTRKFKWGQLKNEGNLALSCVPAGRYCGLAPQDDRFSDKYVTCDSREHRAHQNFGDVHWGMLLSPWGDNLGWQSGEPGRIDVTWSDETQLEITEFPWRDLVGLRAIQHAHFARLFAGPGSLFNQTIRSALDVPTALEKNRKQGESYGRYNGSEVRPPRHSCYGGVDDPEAETRHENLYPGSHCFDLEQRWPDFDSHEFNNFMRTRNKSRLRLCDKAALAQRRVREARRETRAARRFAQLALDPIQREDVEGFLVWPDRPAPGFGDGEDADSYQNRLRRYMSREGPGHQWILHSVRYGRRTLILDGTMDDAQGCWSVRDMQQCMSAAGEVKIEYGQSTSTAGSKKNAAADDSLLRLEKLVLCGERLLLSDAEKRASELEKRYRDRSLQETPARFRLPASTHTLARVFQGKEKILDTYSYRRLETVKHFLAKTVLVPTAAPGAADAVLSLPPGTMVFVGNIAAASKQRLNGALGVVGDLCWGGKPVTQLGPKVLQDSAVARGGGLTATFCSGATVKDFREHKELRYAVRIVNAHSSKMPTVETVLLRPQNLFRARPTIAEKAFRVFRPGFCWAAAGLPGTRPGQLDKSYNASSGKLIGPGPHFHCIALDTDGIALSSYRPGKVNPVFSFVFGKTADGFRLYKRVTALTQSSLFQQQDDDETDRDQEASADENSRGSAVAVAVAPGLRLQPWGAPERSSWSSRGPIDFERDIRGAFEQKWAKRAATDPRTSFDLSKVPDEEIDACIANVVDATLDFVPPLYDAGEGKVRAAVPLKKLVSDSVVEDFSGTNADPTAETDEDEEDVDAIMAEDFIAKTKERGDLNQYWFSKKTIDVFVSVIRSHVQAVPPPIDSKPRHVALVSCPSLYFSLDEETRKHCIVLDIDKQWESDPGFAYYDYNEAPEAQLSAHQHTCSLVVIDPPFITHQVWNRYAGAAWFLATNFLFRIDQPKFLCTTVFENRKLIARLFDNAQPAMYRPSIPNLVYQYCVYVNFSTEGSQLATPNAEVYDDEKWMQEAEAMEKSQLAEKALEEEQKGAACGATTSSGAPKSPPLKINSAGWSKFLDEEDVAPVAPGSGDDKVAAG
eukprot:g1712.t1